MRNFAFKASYTYSQPKKTEMDTDFDKKDFFKALSIIFVAIYDIIVFNILLCYFLVYRAYYRCVAEFVENE